MKRDDLYFERNGWLRVLTIPRWGMLAENKNLKMDDNGYWWSRPHMSMEAHRATNCSKISDEDAKKAILAAQAQFGLSDAYHAAFRLVCKRTQWSEDTPSAYILSWTKDIADLLTAFAARKDGRPKKVVDKAAQ